MTDETPSVVDGSDSAAETDEETIDQRRVRLASRVLRGDEASEELGAFVRELQHEILRLRDALIGANAAAQAVRERFAAIEHTDLGATLARIDELEDQKEALRNLLNMASATANTERLKAEAEKNELRESSARQLAAVRSSATWRLGSAVMLPARVLRRGAAR